MALDAIKFGTLVAFVCRTSQREYGMDDADIRVLSGMVEDFIPRPQPPHLEQDALNKVILSYADVGKIIAFIHQGKKIEAIKDYRALTGCGLKEAKDAVEALEPHFRSHIPHEIGDILRGANQTRSVSSQ